MLKTIWGILSFLVLLAFVSLGTIITSDKPQNFGNFRGAIADFYDNIGVLDFLANGKYKFNSIGEKFKFDDQLNGTATLIYFKAIANKSFACELAKSALNIECTNDPNFWLELKTKTTAQSNIPTLTALNAAATIQTPTTFSLPNTQISEDGKSLIIGNQTYQLGKPN